MSNCHLVAGRSLIDLVASRLALRAPALRAATALTRPNRSAQRLPCGRRASESYTRAAALVDAILKGALPGNLPVGEPTRFTLAVNLKTAAAFGIIVPPAILVRADKVIE